MPLHRSSFVNWIIFVICSFRANGIAWPEPTPAHLDLNLRQRSPWPTGRPLNPLEKRQNADNAHRTCGYLDGNPDDPYTCFGSLKCVTDSIYAAAACCDPDNFLPCLPYTACADEESLELCGSACLGDIQQLNCLSGLYTVCGRATFDYLTERFTQYFCFSESVSPLFLPTSRGEEVESEDGNPVYSNALAISDGIVLNGSDSGSDDDDDSDDETNVGAIVGGVIGGLAVLAALIGGLTYLFYRNKRQKSNPATATVAATATNASHANNDKVVNVPGSDAVPGGGSISTAGQLSPSYDTKTMSYYPPPVNTDPHQSFYSLQPQQPYPQQPMSVYRPMSPQEMPQQVTTPLPGPQSLPPAQHMSQISPTSTSPAPQYEQPVQLQQPSQPVHYTPPVQSQSIPQEQPQAFQLEGTQVDRPMTHDATEVYGDTFTARDDQRANEVP